MVRGFAGFGGAMLFMPFATILFDPRLAVVAFFIIDTSITLPLVANALRHWDWRTVIPCAIGSWAGVWFGAYLLATTDALALRWTICLIIILMVCVMLSGWRYTARPKPPISLGVGTVAGVLGGISQVSAPPLVAYWSAGPFPAEVIRANLICFFFFATLGSLGAFSPTACSPRRRSLWRSGSPQPMGWRSFLARDYFKAPITGCSEELRSRSSCWQRSHRCRCLTRCCVPRRRTGPPSPRRTFRNWHRPSEHHRHLPACR